MESMKRWAPMALVLGLVGCGDPLVQASYRGEPILRLVGRIAALRGVAVQPNEEALVSMFWNTDPSSRPPALVEQQSVSTNVEFPNAFEVLVFDPPTEAHLLTSDPRLAVGFLLVYADADGDRRFGPGDRIVGGNVSKALVWALEEVPAAEAPFGVSLPTGFSLSNLGQMPCELMPRDDRPPNRIAPPVKACTDDASCPPEFACDEAFRVCVPRDSFDLVIGEDFDLAAAGCR